MLEIYGNLWDFYFAGYPIAIPVSGSIKKDGSLVMGAGVAKQAKTYIPGIAETFGAYRTAYGLKVCRVAIIDHNQTRVVYAFPTKYVFYEQSNIDLICFSCKQLVEQLGEGGDKLVVVPRPGCGFGGLSWDAVRAAIAPILDNRVLILELYNGNNKNSK